MNEIVFLNILSFQIQLQSGKRFTCDISQENALQFYTSFGVPGLQSYKIAQKKQSNKFDRFTCSIPCIYIRMNKITLSH